MIEEILKTLLEADDDDEADLDVKEFEREPLPTHTTLRWKGHYNYGVEVRDYRLNQNDPNSPVKTYVGFWDTKADRPHFYGKWPLEDILKGGYVGTEFVPFEMTWPLRVWLRDSGYPLQFPISPEGYDTRKPTLRIKEDQEDDFDFKEVAGEEPTEEVSLEQMMAAEPEFFSRSNNRFFGTKHKYKYGNFLVLRNQRRTHGRNIFGGPSTTSSYVIYEFVRTHDRPEGLLLHRQSTGNLKRAKSMIKRRDFRPWREQVIDDPSLAGLGIWESAEDEDDFDMKDLDVEPELPHPWDVYTRNGEIHIHYDGVPVGGLLTKNPARQKELVAQIRERLRWQPFDHGKSFWDWLGR